MSLLHSYNNFNRFWWWIIILGDPARRLRPERWIKSDSLEIKLVKGDYLFPAVRKGGGRENWTLVRGKSEPLSAVLVLALLECARIVRARPQTCIGLHSGVTGGLCCCKNLRCAQSFSTFPNRGGGGGGGGEITLMLYAIACMSNPAEAAKFSFMQELKQLVPAFICV